MSLPVSSEYKQSLRGTQIESKDKTSSAIPSIRPPSWIYAVCRRIFTIKKLGFKPHLSINMHTKLHFVVTNIILIVKGY